MANVANTVSVGTASATRKIVNVTAGAISATSTDAVNGAELYAAEHSMTLSAVRAAAAPSGSAGFAAETALATANTAESAANTAQSMATTALTTANRAQALAGNAVQYDAGKTSVTLNPGGTAATVHNVAAGVAPTDAADVGQVTADLQTSESFASDVGASTLSAANAYTDQVAARLTSRIDQVSTRADGATAAALASTDIPQAIHAGHAMLGFGVGTWGGETGFAAGVSTRLRDDHTTFKASVNFNSRGQGGGGAGVGYEF